MGCLSSPSDHGPHTAQALASMLVTKSAAPAGVCARAVTASSGSSRRGSRGLGGMGLCPGQGQETHSARWAPGSVPGTDRADPKGGRAVLLDFLELGAAPALVGRLA